MLDALSTLREEEPPRRIAFVSDKVFEPRWWNSFLRPSFAAGCVVAAAILAHALVRPAVAPSVDTAQIEARIQADVQKRIETVVAETEKRDAERAQQLLAESEKRFSEQRQADYASFAKNFDMLNKQLIKVYAMNTGAGFGQ